MRHRAYQYLDDRNDNGVVSEGVSGRFGPVGGKPTAQEARRAS